jgi:hypothetical protein
MFIDVGHNGSIRDLQVVELHHFHHLRAGRLRRLPNVLNSTEAAENGRAIAFTGRGGLKRQ